MKLLDFTDGYFTIEDENGYLYKYSELTIFYGYKINVFGKNPYCDHNFSKFLKNNDIHLNHISGECSSANSEITLQCYTCNIVFKSTYSAIKRNLGKCKHHVPRKPNTVLVNKDFTTDYPHISSEWNYEKNGLILKSYSIHSKKKYWWVCKECGHDWETSLRNRLYFNTGCPKCSRTKSDSKIQRDVFSFLKSLGYKILREKECSLYVKNPKTNRRMFYDNEVYELKLIIEVHSNQHYSSNNGIHRFEAERKGMTPEEAWEEMKYRDNFKREFCSNNNYHYLEISDKDVCSNAYKTIIYNKIKEIKGLAF